MENADTISPSYTRGWVPLIGKMALIRYVRMYPGTPKFNKRKDLKGPKNQLKTLIDYGCAPYYAKDKDMVKEPGTDRDIYTSFGVKNLSALAFGDPRHIDRIRTIYEDIEERLSWDTSLRPLSWVKEHEPTCYPLRIEQLTASAQRMVDGLINSTLELFFEGEFGGRLRRLTRRSCTWEFSDVLLYRLTGLRLSCNLYEDVQVYGLNRIDHIELLRRFEQYDKDKQWVDELVKGEGLGKHPNNTISLMGLHGRSSPLFITRNLNDSHTQPNGVGHRARS